MISKLPIVKGFAFAGCSFTWGQGLHYYRNTDTIKEPPPWHFDSWLLTSSHVDYIKKLRYPRLVADHFNTTEFVRKDNGGNNEQIVEWFDSIFFYDNPGVRRHFHDNYYQCSEFSHLFYQFTTWSRSNFVITRRELLGDVDDDIEIRIPYQSLDHDPTYVASFLRYLDNYQLTIDEFMEKRKLAHMNYVKKWLQKIEAQGIKVYVLNWRDDLTASILQDEWLSDRFITLTYKGETYHDIQGLMFNNKKMEILYDTDNFVVPPSDSHPSPLCHRIIADSIINRLTNDGYKGNLNV